MKKSLLLFLALASCFTLLLCFNHPSYAATYEAIVTLADSTGAGIRGVAVHWDFPDSTYDTTTYTDENGKTQVDYTGPNGSLTVSVHKEGYHPVDPPSGIIYGSTSQYRYYFTMLPN